MSELREMTLGELCAEGGGFIRTGPFGSQLHQSDYVEDPLGVPVVMPKDMAGGRVDVSTIARVSHDTAQSLSHHLLVQGDIALSRRGDVGRSAWIAATDLPVLCGTGSIRVHPGTPRSVRPDFLRYFFRSHLAIDYLEGQAVGATMPNLNAGIVTGMPVPILPHVQQRTAAFVLRTLDDLIENTRRRVEVLEDMARAIYREWFVHFRYPCHESVLLVESPTGWIPDGWECVPASTALEVNPRTPLHRQVEAPLITMGDLPSRGMSCFPSERRIGGSGSKFKNGDVLFARITPCLENGKTGLVQSLDGDEVARGSTEFIVLRGNRVGTAYTYFLARSPEFRDHAEKSMSGASGRQRVRNECFDAYLVATPPPAIAEKFEQTVRPMLEMIHTLSLETRELASLRDLLLPKLVTGQIDVSSLDVDSVLEGSVG